MGGCRALSLLLWRIRAWAALIVRELQCGLARTWGKLGKKVSFPLHPIYSLPPVAFGIRGT
jgi:hypothetical protein